MEDLIAKELAIARELIAAKRRERALLALKKKKLREGQLEQIDAYLLNVEQASFAAGSICPGLASPSLQCSSFCSCTTGASQLFDTPTVSADMARAVEVFMADKESG